MNLFNKKKKTSNKTDKEKKQVKKSEKLEVDKKIKKEKGSKNRVKSAKADHSSRHDHGQSYKNLIRPVITEKASALGMYNSYIFEISPRTNKLEIKKAVEKLYGVKPIKINIINMRGKNVKSGRQWGKLKDWKKAIVTLKAGDKIEVYEGV